MDQQHDRTSQTRTVHGQHTENNGSFLLLHTFSLFTCLKIQEGFTNRYATIPLSLLFTGNKHET